MHAFPALRSIFIDHRRTMLVVTAAVIGVLPLAACAPMTQQQKEATELRRFCERNPQAGTTCLGFHGRG